MAGGGEAVPAAVSGPPGGPHAMVVITGTLVPPPPTPPSPTLGPRGSGEGGGGTQQPRRSARWAWFALVVTTLVVMLITNSLALYSFLRSGGGGGGGGSGGSSSSMGVPEWLAAVSGAVGREPDPPIVRPAVPVAGIVLPPQPQAPPQKQAPLPTPSAPLLASPQAAPAVPAPTPSVPLPPPVVPDTPQPEAYPHTFPAPELAPGTVLDEAMVADTWMKGGDYRPEALALLPREQLDEIKRLALFTHALAKQPNPRLPSPATHKRRLIIALSTGHTGTMWLVRVLRCTAQSMRAEHEPKPSLVSFHQVLLHGLPDTYALRQEEKWPPFLAMMNNATAGEGAIYAEISHMFIKSWADLFANWLAEADPTGARFDVTVVHLRRFLPHVVRSFLTDKSSWHPRTDVKTWSGGEYTLHHRNFALLPPVYEHGAEDSIDEVLGYLHDMELQFARFQMQFPHFTYYQVRAEEIFTVPGALRLLADLGLNPVQPRCITILGTARPVNQHVSWKGPELLEVPPEVFVARTLLYEYRYAALGIPMPLMPQLHEVAACNTTAEPTEWCPLPVPRLSVAEMADYLTSHPMARNFQPVAPLIPRWNLPTPSPSRSPHYSKW